MTISDDIDRMLLLEDIKKVFKAATSRSWKVKLVIWRDDGEEWEINPKGSRQTGVVSRPVDRVTVVG